jgi:CysZ protein
VNDAKLPNRQLSRDHAADFWLGFSSLPAGIKLLLEVPRALGYAVVPSFIFLLLEGGFIWLSVRLLQPWVTALLTSAFNADTASALGWLATALAAVMGWVFAGLLAPVISAPALERIVRAIETELGAPPRPPLGFWKELWCGLQCQLFGSVLAIVFMTILTSAELLLPHTAIIATPSKLLIGALGLAWGLFDYPLTLRGMPVRERLAFLQRHAACVIGFASSFALAFWLPCCGVVLLPAGVAASTLLVVKLQNDERAADAQRVDR